MRKAYLLALVAGLLLFTVGVARSDSLPGPYAGTVTYNVDEVWLVNHYIGSTITILKIDPSGPNITDLHVDPSNPPNNPGYRFGDDGTGHAYGGDINGWDLSASNTVATMPTGGTALDVGSEFAIAPLPDPLDSFLPFTLTFSMDQGDPYNGQGVPEPATVISGLLGVFGFAIRRFVKRKV